jgi:hypothetical protein
MPIKRSNQSPASKAKAILASRQKSVRANKKRSHEELVSMVADGSLVTELIEDLRVNGINDQRLPLKFFRLFEDALSLVGDLRIGAVYSTGVAQFSKTQTNSAVNAWFGQRCGLTCGWAWPQDSSIDRFMGPQHRPLLEHLAIDVSKAKVTKSSSTSNRLYDVGIGRNIFLSVSKGSAVQNADNAEVGAASASFTASVVFIEEASQINQKLIAPLISRVEKSVSPVAPLRILGTKGGGSGIELSIAQNAQYQFVPHCKCNNCELETHLEPFGTIIKSHKVTNPTTGEVEEKFLSSTGNIQDWFKAEDGSPIIVCSHCQQELDDDTRTNCYFKDAKSGLDVPQFIKQVVEQEWLNRRIQVSIDFTAASRQKAGRLIARSIIEESFAPSNILDFLQQRVGVTSQSLGGSISQENINGAFARYPLVLHKPVTLVGIDQGRASAFCSVVQFRHDENITDPNELWANIRCNLLFCKGIPITDLPGILIQYGVEGGCVDAKPGIMYAHQLREETGVVLGEQFANVSISDDLRKGVIKDNGLEFPVWKFRTSKPGRACMDAFIAGRIGIHPDLEEFNDLRPDSFARHLRSISWCNDTATIKKAADSRDDLFFSLMFAFLAYSIYIQDPQEILIQSWNWWS